MSFSINIDTGGTFTDGFFTRGTELKTVKVLTTPHDLTVCLLDCIREGSSKYGLSAEDMLRETNIIRYSTTIGTNTIIQRSGSKIGLIVSSGFEESVYGDSRVENPEDPLCQLVSREMITGVGGEIGQDGREVSPLSREEVLVKVQRLIDQGARAIVVSLRQSYLNSGHEQEIKKIVKEEFPPYYLESPTIFLASEISDRPGERLRTNAAVLNAYIHRSMAKYLYKAEEDLRQKCYDRPLLVVHNSGGVARVAKSKALSTYSSGPVAGLVGVDNLCRMYGFKNVISTDMGGTSLDIGVIRDGQFDIQLQPVISGLKINHAMVDIKAVGAGGGSIAQVEGGRVEVGPESAGSLPGPACFNLGGTRPTVTDADLALGFIDPENFLGGRIRLNRDRAVDAIRKYIAGPLGIPVEEAAAAIKREVDAKISACISQLIEKEGQGWCPEAVFAYGGAGPTHCCGYTSGLPVTKIITSPFSPVFSAFGLANMDVVHKYAWSRGIALREGDYDEIAGVIARALEGLRVKAHRDMRGEGFRREDISFNLEVYGKSSSSEMEERVIVAGGDLPAGFMKQTGSRFDLLTSVILNAVVVINRHQIPCLGLESSDTGSRAKTGDRKVFWPAEGAYLDTPIYSRKLLRPGNIVEGPAVAEAEDTTYVIPGGYRLAIDEYMNGIIKGVD